MKVLAVCSHPETQRRIRAAAFAIPAEITKHVLSRRAIPADFGEISARADVAVIAAHEDEPCHSLEFVKAVKSHSPNTRVVVVSLRADLDHAIEAFRSGVTDYLRSPWSEEDFATALKRIPVFAAKAPQQISRTVSKSPEMIRTNEIATRAASTESNVLITGETGTGKEVMAEFLHRNSNRRAAPFVCINCAALPEGLLESELFGYERGAFTGAVSKAAGKFTIANGGVVFLDEIGDMSLNGQARLLRVIENREIYPLGGTRMLKVDVRFVAATNQDLHQRAAEGRFRVDLLFRLNVLRIHLPPLRERREDIPELLSHFMAKFNRSWGQRIDGFSTEACELLTQYNWPGNIRELRNVVEATYVNASGRIIYPQDLPAPIRSVALGAPGASGEKQRLTDALFETNWNVSQAAAKLRWCRMTVYRKLERYHLRRDNDVTPM